MTHAAPAFTQAVSETAVFIPMSEQATRIVEQRYLAPGETYWGDVANRIANTLFPERPVRDTRNRLYEAIYDRKFLPNSPALANLGRNGFTHACLVRNIADSYTGDDNIPDSIAWAMRAHKEGSGTGFSLSDLRPSGSSVAGTGGVASGPLSFLKVFDMATSVTKQGGFRRGANMAILDWTHDDALAFVTAKVVGAACGMECEDPTHYHNFNFSLGVDDGFFTALHNGVPRVTELWIAIALAAWKCGDPGLWFSDTTNKDNPTPWVGDFKATNPCGETPLLNNESCVLGSVNLLHYMYMSEWGAFYLDEGQLWKDIPLYIEALDRMIDAAVYPSEDIELATKLTRKVGLGIMGLADVLALHGYAYDSQEGRDLAGSIMEGINSQAVEYTKKQAEEKGPAPAYYLRGATNAPWRRNAIVTTVAPTGTISLIAGCSQGVEPIFAVQAESHRYLDPDDTAKVTVELITHPMVTWLIEAGLDHMVGYYTEARDVSIKDHLLMQAAVQAHTENAVSKTINMASDAMPRDIQEAYLTARKLGLKGITIYRETSKGEAPWQRPELKCPNCGGPAIQSEGCLSCPNCGSKCDL